MKPGDSIKFNFAGKSKEATVHKVFPNTVYLKVDFDKDKGKIVKRKINEITAKKAAKKKAKSK